MTLATTCLKIAAVLCCVVLSAHQLHATIACPVSLLDGKADADTLALSFHNKGKLPLQELEFRCASHGTSGRRGPACHDEAGLFFPGNSYDVTFLYAGKNKLPIQVSLLSARLSDGSVWRANRDQPCRPLKIERKKTR